MYINILHLPLKQIDLIFIVATFMLLLQSHFLFFLQNSFKLFSSYIFQFLLYIVSFFLIYFLLFIIFFYGLLFNARHFSCFVYKIVCTFGEKLLKKIKKNEKRTLVLFVANNNLQSKLFQHTKTNIIQQTTDWRNDCCCFLKQSRELKIVLVCVQK